MLYLLNPTVKMKNSVYLLFGLLPFVYGRPIAYVRVGGSLGLGGSHFIHKMVPMEDINERTLQARSHEIELLFPERNVEDSHDLMKRAEPILIPQP